METSEEGYTLVLGSGAARGIAHIGVLLYLEEHHIPIKAVVGCSIGAQLGAFWAAGHPAESLKQTLLGLKWTDSVRIFFPDRFKGGFSSGSGADEFSRRFLGAKHIQELALPFAAAATNYHTGELVMITEGNAVRAIRASISIPGIMTPVQLNDLTLIDGAVASTLPLEWVEHNIGGPVIAVNVQDSTPPDSMPGPLGVLRHSNCLMQTSMLKRELQLNPPEFLIEPNIQGCSKLKFHAVEHLIEEGYNAAKLTLGLEQKSQPTPD